MLWFGSHSLLNCICRLMVGCSYRGRWMVTGLSTASCTTSWPPFWAFLSSSICSAELQSGQRSTQEWGWEKLIHPHGLHWQGFTQEDESCCRAVRVAVVWARKQNIQREQRKDGSKDTDQQVGCTLFWAQLQIFSVM